MSADFPPFSVGEFNGISQASSVIGGSTGLRHQPHRLIVLSERVTQAQVVPILVRERSSELEAAPEPGHRGIPALLLSARVFLVARPVDVRPSRQYSITAWDRHTERDKVVEAVVVDGKGVGELVEVVVGRQAVQPLRVGRRNPEETNSTDPDGLLLVDLVAPINRVVKPSVSIFAVGKPP